MKYVQECSQKSVEGERCNQPSAVDESGYAADFCEEHQQMVRDGHPQFCVKCNEAVEVQG